MPRTGRLCAALAGLLWSASALRAAAAPVRLVSPAGGTVLEAGALAELAWEPLAPFDRCGRVEEWEAFLSLDGGVHYTVRVTPHLDLGLRRIVWRVPPAPSADARLLLRFGDERQETVFELPQRFTIAAPAAQRLDLAPAAVSLSRGEPARPGQDGVVSWVEGDRRGATSRSVVAAEPPAARAPRSLSEDRGAVAVAEAPVPSRDLAADAAAPRHEPPVRRRTGFAAKQTAAAAPLSILLLTTRRNE